jgi:alpha-L-rhamnosidase
MIETGIQSWKQAAYEMEACDAAGKPFGQTGRVESSESVLVAWPFAALASRQSVGVRVRVWGADGSASDWSESAVVEAALLDAADWSAQFVRPAWDEDTSKTNPGPLLRREFSLRAGVKQARLYVSALGLYEAQINGQTVGDHVMTPGWTSYHHRLRYQIFDVTALLREGPNAIGAMLGDGWFRGRMGFGGGRKNIYGDRIALLAQLEVTYADGSTQTIVTDENWKAARGPIQMNNIYDGETYDARLEQAGWSESGFDDKAWDRVTPVKWDLTTLFAPMGPAVRRTEEVAPVKLITSPSGKLILDFGQNLVGRLRIKVRGSAGQTVTIRHAEVLEHGELGVRPLRYAKATDSYTLRGGGEEVYEPRFTFHGFRYAEITGWPGKLDRTDIVAEVCHSDMERTGWFECSNALLNRLHENVRWSMRGNFLDIPTDCPQRDERLGWTGDIEVFSPTASYIYDASGFLTSWLRDLAAEQKELGGVPFVVPTTMPKASPPAAAWGDAATVIPWVLYQRFGDQGVLAAQFESMCAWTDLLESIAGDSRLWDTGFQFGDWLDPAAPPDRPGDARTPSFLIATAYFARSAELTALAAGVLGREADAAHYGKLASEVRAAFNREYVTPTGRTLSDTATAYSLVLQFALLPTEEQRQKAGKRLAELVRAAGFRISTGFVGTPLICDALCSTGYADTAFRLLTQTRNPSWLYPVSMGATTIWERWDSMLPDGSINPGEMTSFNHYALGAVADWMHRTIGGLAPAEPGYRRLEFVPKVGAGITHAEARHLTPYGMAACAWKITDGSMTVSVEVPANTTAVVTLPGKAEAASVEVGSGSYTWTYPYQDGRAKRAHLTIDSKLSEIIDDPEAFEIVMKLVDQQGTELAEHTLSQENLPLREAVGFMMQGDALLANVAKALAELK